MSTRAENQAKTIQTIENSVKAGFTLSEVIRMLLKMSFTQFAKDNALKQEELSMCFLGYKGRELPKVRRVVARKLGLRMDQLGELIKRFAVEPNFE